MEEPKSIYVIGFQEVLVEEDPGNGRCIWCNLSRKFNISHILSKKIIRNNNPQNVLKRSVCMECNSYFGNKIEDWFYKYSPLGTWANQLKGPINGVLTNLKHVPNFLWNDRLKEWIIINHDKVQDLLATQLLLNKENKLMTFHYDHSGKKSIEELIKINMFIRDKMLKGEFSDYIDNKFPENFNPRFFIYKSKLILVTKSDEDKVRLIAKLSNDDENESKYELSYANVKALEKMTIHYSWSLQRYFILCSKIGFEFMSFMMGQEFCQHNRFAPFKKAIKEAKFDKIVIPYIEGIGYKVNRFTPPGWISCIEIGKDIIGFPTMSGQKSNCHTIFVYSVKGYLLLDVRLFSLEPCQLVIAKGCYIDEIYYIEYDINEETLRFYKAPKSEIVIKESLEYKNVIESIQSDQHLAMVTLRDLSPPTILM